MKREFLKELGLTDEQIDKIMAENGKDIEKAKGDTAKLENDLATKETEIETLQGQLKEANTQIESFKEMDIEGIKQSADEWKAKYETDTEKLNKQLAEKDYEYNLREYLSKYKFANERIKNSIAQDLKEKEFKLENGVFLGADEYMKQLQESEPTSFINDEPKDPIPQIVKPGGRESPTEPSFGFGQMFAGVRPRED